MWIQYTPDGDIQLINHYVDGLLEGTAVNVVTRNERVGGFNCPTVVRIEKP